MPNYFYRDQRYPLLLCPHAVAPRPGQPIWSGRAGAGDEDLSVVPVLLNEGEQCGGMLGLNRIHPCDASARGR